MHRLRSHSSLIESSWCLQYAGAVCSAMTLHLWKIK